MPASIVVAQLLFLEAENPDKDIFMYINSPGGSVTDGMAIIDCMDYIKPDVSTICIGSAASMAAVILSSGTPGKRCILPSSEVMVHQPKGSFGKAQVSDIKIQADRMIQMKEDLIGLLAKNCGVPYDEMVKITDRDYFMTAKEALSMGIVDKIITRNNRY